MNKYMQQWNKGNHISRNITELANWNVLRREIHSYLIWTYTFTFSMNIQQHFIFYWICTRNSFLLWKQKKKRIVHAFFFIEWSKLWTKFNEHVLAKNLDEILHSITPLIACFASCVNILHLIVRLYTWMLSAVIWNTIFHYISTQCFKLLSIVDCVSTPHPWFPLRLRVVIPHLQCKCFLQCGVPIAIAVYNAIQCWTFRCICI